MTDMNYMDCWHYIAPLIPISNETSQTIYVMVFQALGRRCGQWKD